MSDDRAQLLRMIREKAILRGSFVLASGKTSSYYVDARQVTLSSLGARLVGRVIYQLIAGSGAKAVAGLTMGADPVVTAVAIAGAAAGKPIDGLIVRKKAKDHGTGKLIEGPLRPKMSAVVVEDTSTTGASALQAAQTLGEHGVSVLGIITLIDRDEGARAAVEEAGLKFDAVFTISEILAGDIEPPKPPVDPESGGGATPTKRRMLLHADGSSIGNPGPGGAGFVLFDEKGEVERGMKSLGRTTNNVAEYHALILGLEAARLAGATDLTVRMDSQLIIYQVLGRWKVKHPDLQPLHATAQIEAKTFEKIKFEFVPRELNRIADSLATKASATRKT